MVSLLSDSVIIHHLVRTVSNTLFWGVIIVACFTIFLGWLLEKKFLPGRGWDKVLSKIIIWIGFPGLILKNFMIDLTFADFKNMVSLFILGILLYALLSTCSKYFFFKTGKDDRMVLGLCVALPSTIYFGLPMARALADGDWQLSQVNQAQNMFGVGFWIFLCVYALYEFQHKPLAASKKVQWRNRPRHWSFKANEKEIKRLVLSPIIISLMVGLVLWLMQMIPGIDIIHVTNNGWNTIAPGHYSITRLDALIPGFNQAMTIFAALPSPLAWLSVGAIIARNNLKDTFVDKKAWYASSLKMFFVPALTITCVVIVAVIGKKSGQYTISTYAMVTCAMLIASPAAPTIASYGITYDKGAKIASHVAIQTTLMAIVTMPLWAIVASIIGQASFFQQVEAGNGINIWVPSL